MTISQKICVGMILVALTCAVIYLYADCSLLHKLINKLIAKVNQYDNIIDLMNYRITLLGDKVERMEAKERKSNEAD